MTEPRPTTVAKIAKVNIIARKFAETLEFYRLVGVKIPVVKGEPSETRHAPANGEAVSFAIDNEALARIYSAEWRGPEPRNSVLITAQFASRLEVDNTYERLLKAGHSPIQPPYDAFWGARYAIVADPEGNSVGLESPTEQDRTVWPPRESPNP